MTDQIPKAPRVFVSYSWSSAEHENRILEWAEKLVGDGVDVILDKWHLKEGQDKYAFMEKMVTDPEVVKVLVFSDGGYAEKADARKGGVGTESQIISSEVYAKVAQEKFLPILCELSPEGDPCLPTFLKSLIYFDFSSAERFHVNYERLVRAIFGKPLHKRPPIGRPPEYILTDDKPSRWSRPLLEDFKEAVAKDRSSQHGHAVRFLDTFAERMEDFRIDPKGQGAFDDRVIASIDIFLPFRDDFVEFVDTVGVFRNHRDSYEILADFFERCLLYKFRKWQIAGLDEKLVDNFDFILHELFLYTATVLTRRKRFDELRLLTTKPYILPDTADSGSDRIKTFVEFRGYCSSLVDRTTRLKLNMLDLMADILRERATLSVAAFEQLIQTDGLLFLMSLLNPANARPWYPRTLVYARFGRTFDLFARAASKAEFVRLAALLGVSGKNELLTKYESGFKRHGVDQWGDLTCRCRVDFKRLFGFEALDSIG